MKSILKRLPAALFLLSVGLLASAPTVHAISVLPPSFEGLVEKSDTIVQGTVVDRESRWVTNAAGNRVIKTYYTVRVTETAKGIAAHQVTLEFLGGTVGDETLEVGGMPTFRKGERAWFFIKSNGRVFCPLAYAHHGAYLVRTDPVDGSQRLVRLNGSPLASVDAIKPETTGAQRRVELHQALTSQAFSSAISRELLRQQNRQEADR